MRMPPVIREGHCSEFPCALGMTSYLELEVYLHVLKAYYDSIVFQLLTYPHNSCRIKSSHFTERSFKNLSHTVTFQKRGN